MTWPPPPSDAGAGMPPEDAERDADTSPPSPPPGPPPSPPPVAPEPPTTIVSPGGYPSAPSGPPGYQSPPPPAYPGGEQYAGSQAYPPAQGYPSGGYPAVPERRTNTLAIVSMIVSLGGFITLISAPIGAILGHMARRQIRETGEEGDAFALTGIIVGWALTGLVVLACCLGIGFFVIAASTTTVN